MTDAAPLLISTRNDGVLRLVLNRPAQRNSLSAELIDGLAAALEGAARDGATRVIVIAAVGDAFCAGHDLKQLQALRAGADGGAVAYAALFSRCSAMMQAIVTNPKPVIAMVQGAAVAAGCQHLQGA